MREASAEDDASKGLDTMAEAARIRGWRQRLRRRDDGPEGLGTTAEVLAEEDDTKVSTTTSEASAEEAEETTRPSERLQRRRRRCVYGLRVLMATTAASEE